MVTKIFMNSSGPTSSQAPAKKPSKALLRKIGLLEQITKTSKSCSLEDVKAIQGRITLLEKACSPHKKTRIRWANLNNRINQRINNLQVSVIAPKVSAMAEPVEEKNSFPSWLSYAGIGLGTVTGLFFRKVELTTKTKSFEPVLKGLNKLKQDEISISLTLPFLIYISQVGIEMSKDQETKAVFQRFLKAAKKTVSLPLITNLITTFASMVIAAQAKRHLPGEFDPSGHMMLKIQIASLTNQLLSQGPKMPYQTLLLLAYTAYILTDAVFLHNTASAYHTGNEILAGLGIGAGLSGIAALISQIYKKAPKEVSA